MIGVDGAEICRHWKAHLCDDEKLYLHPGPAELTVCKLAGLETSVAIGICYDICSFSFQRQCYRRGEVGLVLLPVYCGADQELGDLDKIPPGEAVASTLECAAGYASRLQGPAFWDCDTYGPNGRGNHITLLVVDQPFGSMVRHGYPLVDGLLSTYRP